MMGNRKGAWTKEEDILLIKCIEKHGEGKWHQVPLRSGLNRCRKSCRLRWMNYLRPNIKRGSFAADEIDLIIKLHNLLGNRWSLIAGRLPGRTANDIKNYWNSHLSKKLAGNVMEVKPKTKLQRVQVIRPQARTFTGRPIRISGHQPTPTPTPTPTLPLPLPPQKLQQRQQQQHHYHHQQQYYHHQQQQEEHGLPRRFAEQSKWWNNMIVNDNGLNRSTSMEEKGKDLCTNLGREAAKPMVEENSMYVDGGLYWDDFLNIDF